MESQGAGIQVLMQAQLAVDMGLPIYGVIALTYTATDKEGRSVPAPGLGVLTSAKEIKTKFPSPLLDINYRARQLDFRRKQIKQWAESEFELLQSEVSHQKETHSDEEVREYLQYRTDNIFQSAQRQEKDAQYNWGNDFWRRDPSIAPMKGSLATWGLTVDDIGAIYFHGTSTVINEKNECLLLSRQLEHLGRSKGNAVLGIFQKYLTGHPKGAAAAWLTNGAIDVLRTGLVPGNRNADNVDHYLEQFSNIMFPNRSVQTDGVRAVSVFSFGFGQVGGQALIVHPDYLYATLDEKTLEAYRIKNGARYKASYRHLHKSMVENNLINVKGAPPYTSEQEQGVYLDPTARVTRDSKTGLWSYPKEYSTHLTDSQAKAEKTKSIIQGLALSASPENVHNVGVDIELISAINVNNDTFIERNFTDDEQAYCRQAPSPQSSFAGTWSAKEAVFKSLNVSSQGGGAPLRDIEIVRNENGAPTVQLHGKAKEIALSASIRDIKVSISHDDGQSVAVCFPFLKHGY